MSEKNPYSTPEASLNVSSEQDEKYQPDVFSFNGRIGRLRYLAYSFGTSLLLLVAMSVLMGLAATLGTTAEMKEGDMPVMMIVITALYYIVSIVFAAMFGKRRLNDLDKSGWWFLLFLVPIANIVLAIYVLFFSGSEGSNNFGPASIDNTTGVKVLALLIPILLIIGGIVAAVSIPAYQSYIEKAQNAQMQQGQ